MNRETSSNYFMVLCMTLVISIVGYGIGKFITLVFINLLI